MKPRLVTLLLLALFAILIPASIVTAQGDDIYFVNSGHLWQWPSGGAGTRPPPHAVALAVTMPRVASFAINSKNFAYITNGTDGNIYRTDGVFGERIHNHNGLVRQLAFGSSDDVLFYSVVGTPQAPGSLTDGQIYALNLTTGTSTLRFTVQQSTVDNAWWGAFTVDGNRFYVGTRGGGIFELRGTQPPALAYRNAGDQIQALTAETGPLFYTTGGGEIYRLRYLQDRTLGVKVVGGNITHLSYAPLPSTQSEPCELLIQLSGADAGLINLFSPVLRGPNLHWLSPDVQGNGGKVGTGAYRYFVPRAIYWVSMDTKADTSQKPNPGETRVDCTGAKKEISFSF